MTAIKRVLISVSDKKGIVKFASALNNAGIEIISTGGTFSELKSANINVKDVSSVTSFPEILDGRVKTLHPKIHGGLLNIRNNKEHQKTINEQKIENIDLLVVNLYPFENTIKNKSDYETCIENIDIGGPAMIRAAAKNHESVGVIVDPDDYDEIINEIENNDLSLTKEKKVNFTHPYFNNTNVKLQKELHLLQGKKRTWFCGSYFGYGFHEDGLKSSIELIKNFKI